MRKKMKRWLTMLLAMVLVVTSVDMTSLVAEAAETEDKTYTMDYLQKYYASGVTINESDASKLTFNGNWQSIFYKMPSDINSADIVKITYNVTSGNTDKFAYKTYTEDAYAKWWEQQTDCDYGTGVITPADATKGELKYLAITSNFATSSDSTPIEMTISGVTFTVKKAESTTPVTPNITPAGEAEDKSWTADKLTRSWGVETYAITGDRMELTIEGKYSQICLNLPEAVDMADCESITFAISEQSGPIALKLYVDGTEKWVDYSKTGSTLYKYTPAPLTEGKVNAIGFMLNDESLTSITAVIDGIYFDMKEATTPPITPNITPAGEAEDKSWTADKLTFDSSSWNAVSTANGDKYDITYQGQNNEAKYELPEAVELADCEGVTFAMSANNYKMAVKLYDAEWNPLAVGYSEANTQLAAVNVSGVTGTVAYVGVMLNADAADGTVTLDGVFFDMKEATTPPVTPNITPAGEAEDKSWTADKLTFDSSSWNAVSTANGDKYDITYQGQNNEAKYELPEAVELADCEGVTFAMSANNYKMAVKLYDAEWNPLAVGYPEANTQLAAVNVSGVTGTVAYVGVMLNADAADGTVTLDGVFFDMKEATTPPVTPNITPAGEAEDVRFTADSMKGAFDNIDSAPVIDTDSKKMNITFDGASQYKQIQIQLMNGESGATVSITDCEKVIIALSEVNTGSNSLAFKLYDAYGSELATVYSYTEDEGLYSFAVPEGAAGKEVGFVGVQINNTDGAATGNVTLDGVLFDMKKAEATTPSANITPAGDVEDKSWTADELTVAWTDNATSALNGDKISAEFSAQYGAVCLKLPEVIDMSMCESVTFAVSEQSGPIALKLYEEGKEQESFVKYSQSGSTLYKYTEGLPTGKVDRIALMWNDDALTSLSATFDGIYFDMKTTDDGEGEGETPSVPTTTYTKYYTFKDASEVTGYGFETKSVDENGALTLSSSGEQGYAQIAYNIPDGVDTSSIKSIKFHVKEGSGSALGFKVYAETPNSGWSNNDSTQGTAWSIANEITIKTTNPVEIFAFMNHGSDGAAVIDGLVIDYFTITTTTEQTGGSDTAPENPEVKPDATGNITPVAPSAEDFSWKGDVLTKDYDTTTSSVQDETAARWNITFGGEWKEVRFKLPQTIDLAMLNSVTVAISSQTTPISFKFYNGETGVWVDLYSKSGEQLYKISDTTKTGEVDTFAIMLHSSDVKDGASCALDGLMFDMIAADEVEETYEVKYGFSDLVYDTHSTTASYALVENGHKMTFTKLNEELRLLLPEYINLEKCKTVTVHVASQVGPVNFSLGDGSTKMDTYNYNIDADSYVKAPTVTNKVNSLTVQCGGLEFTEGSTIIITGVTFVMKGKQPLPAPEDGVYNMNHFDLAENATAGVTITEDAAAGTAELTFDTAGESVTIAIPDSVDLNHLTGITVNGVAGEKINVVILDKDGNVIATGTDGFVDAKCNPEFASIKITSRAANNTVTLESIAFTVDPNAFEAIVLNGNFARDDVSMWKAAMWGTVDGKEGSESTNITTAVSPTPIFDDVYTYGVLSRRSSPYVCFAQDVTDRVKKTTNYTWEFYVKMSEDYRDVEQQFSMIEFSPYYVDAAGKEHYSMELLGNTKTWVTPDGWVKCSGKMYIPEDAEKVVLRIVEQGTNYGQGECVLGSYYVTGVKMEETGMVYYFKNNGGGGGATTNTTVTKEATWTGTYNMNELLVEWGSATYKKNNDNSLSINFKNNYDEVRMDLPRELDMSTVAYVKTAIASQNVPIAVKLYSKGSQVDVAYYNDIKELYTWVPSYTGMVDAIGIMSLATPNPEGAFANFSNITFGLTAEPAPIPPRTSIVLNGDFSDSDLSDWKASFWGDGVTMTQKRSSTPIAPGIYNYASYSKRTSPYQCFAQDITEAVEEGETYTFSFWARLSMDYVGAPPAQRTIQFAPYTTDSNGVSDYNPKLDGTYAQVCEPGEWTYFEGTYKVTNPKDVKKVVIRILEQGTNYGQGDCVLGGYDIANVKMEKYIPEPPSIDEDVPNLKDALTEVFGEDFIVGTALTVDGVDDIGLEMLVNKHFNAITVGNELKPDALFNYSNDKHTELKTITFNGQSLEVPTLYFYRAEELLDKVLEWNEAHPESPIKMRGHVLVWHSQTPEWFFREGYVVGQNADGTENYVSPEVMNLRLEWYIKTVLEHFTGEDSPYKDLFYGWDVVNEAVRDGSTDYRTDKVSTSELPSNSTHGSNSSWWAVYQSNEFIINAFKYANMYAPADVELYYNDYNECDSKKMQGIVKLLTAVKEAEGTRIDGMGMQGHYGMMNPALSAFEEAVRAYSAVVGKVMITEWDLKASGDISTESNLQKEYLAQADRYRDFYEVMLKLRKEGIDVGGFVFWGVIDPHSWLQTQSNVGGGADGTMTHCPLLFDGDYKVKPAYWAFVDYDMVNPDYESPVKDAADDKDDADKDEEATTPDDSKTDDTADTADSTADTNKADEDAEPADSKDTSSDEGSGVLPFAVGGGVASVGILAGIIAWLKKRGKKV